MVFFILEHLQLNELIPDLSLLILDTINSTVRFLYG